MTKPNTLAELGRHIEGPVPDLLITTSQLHEMLSRMNYPEGFEFPDCGVKFTWEPFADGQYLLKHVSLGGGHVMMKHGENAENQHVVFLTPSEGEPGCLVGHNIHTGYVASCGPDGDCHAPATCLLNGIPNTAGATCGPCQ